MNRKKWQAIEKARHTLLLGEAATLAEIKRAYHRLCKRYHPDRISAGDDPDEAQMYRLTAAYELLMEYCAEYRFPLQAPDDGSADPYDPEDWWMDRFGESSMWKHKPRKK
ncbi:J domain-containing protein [Desulfogranum mediterraneum]|uniref:J domain-containing protein n=1 Tax=Desulfogranum mediterraneum TaxID=160661 RepID=UPI0003F57FFD|nr:J domain-containing protein [Desulfogranum mediterraneum]